MPALPGDLLRYVIGGVLFLVVVVVGRKAWRWYAGREERALEAQLREAIESGDLRRAGDIQMRRGNLLEASRIYLRAKEHVRAGHVLLKLGDEKAAADEFEKGEEWTRAAPLLRKHGELLRAAACYERSAIRGDRLAAAECLSAVDEHLKAGRIYQDLEEYEKAADCFAKVEDLESLDVALTMLENAALAKSTSADRRKELWRRAGELAVKAGAHDRAARAFDEAGDLAEAAKIYETALKKLDLAAALYAEAGRILDSERLTDAAGGSSVVLETRLARARARGDRSLADKLETQLDALTGGPSTPATKVARRDEGAGVTARYNESDKKLGRGVAVARFEDRFELLGELGRGGMGVVYKAKDLKLGRYVAMKFLPEDVEKGSTLHRLFQREARAAAALSHPSIVTVYDVGELGGREFIAMELVDGETLDRVIDETGPMPIAEALDVMEKVLVAMEYAHGQSVIHRDLKPANLMRTRGAIKVMDFGLAKVISGRSSSGGTVIGGTPSYMPPEQKTGDTDHRSDVFALGATFYELMSGVLPGNPGEPASATSRYPTLRERVPEAPARLSDLVMRCLEHERQDRPQDIVSVLREVREIRAELVEGALEAPPRRRPAAMADTMPKAVEEAKKKRAPLPRIAREEEDPPPRVEHLGRPERVERPSPNRLERPTPQRAERESPKRAERVERTSAGKPAAAAKRPLPREEIVDVVETGALRGKPR